MPVQATRRVDSNNCKSCLWSLAIRGLCRRGVSFSGHLTVLVIRIVFHTLLSWTQVMRLRITQTSVSWCFYQFNKKKGHKTDSWQDSLGDKHRHIFCHITARDRRQLSHFWSAVEVQSGLPPHVIVEYVLTGPGTWSRCTNIWYGLYGGRGPVVHNYHVNSNSFTITKYF